MMEAGKRIYIAGCGGMLGDAFYRVFGDAHELKCTDIDVNAPWLSSLDFRDFDSYRRDVVAFEPDYLFHLGAHTNLEYCEQHPDDAYGTNTLSVEHAVHIVNELRIPLLYISTAGILTARRRPMTIGMSPSLSVIMRAVSSWEKGSWPPTVASTSSVVPAG